MVFAESLSFWICWDRFGFIGVGGGGAWFGVSSVTRDLWRVFSAESSFGSVEEDDLGTEMSFVCGSSVSGMSVNVSLGSMIAVVKMCQD